MSVPITILNIDVDESNRREINKLLDDQTYTVLEAGDEGELVTHLVSSSRIDLVMLRTTGMHETVRKFIDKAKQFRPGLPVVLITDKKRLSALLECTKLGGDDYVTLPLSEQKLLNVLSNVVALHRRAGQPALVEADLPAGRKFGQYDLKGILGTGGAGIVYLAEKTVQGTKVTCALKVLHPVGKRNEEQNRDILERFLREAELASKLSHPNIVKIIDYGLNEDVLTPFIAMELVPGTSLRSYIEGDQNKNLLNKTSIVLQIAQALEVIHAHDICHRDIKPENILLDSNFNVKVTDFGIARLPNSELTQTLKVVGTPSYMAPESYSSSNVDHRADLFSLGVLTYELFVGVKPFNGRSISQLRQVIRTHAPIKPCKIDPGLPTEFQNILAKLLKKKPEDRYQSISAFKQEFKAAIDALSTPPKTEFIAPPADGQNDSIEMAETSPIIGEKQTVDWQ